MIRTRPRDSLDRGLKWRRSRLCRPPPATTGSIHDKDPMV